MQEQVQTAISQLQEVVRQAEKEVDELKALLNQKKSQIRCRRKALNVLSGKKGMRA